MSMLDTMERVFSEYVVHSHDGEERLQADRQGGHRLLEQLPLAADAVVKIFGLDGVGLAAIQGFKEYVHGQLVASDARITRVLTRIKQLSVSGMHFEASTLSLWFSSSGQNAWVPATCVGSLNHEGTIQSFRYLVDADDRRALFDAMNGFPTAESVVRNVIHGISTRDGPLLSSLYAHNVTYNLQDAMESVGREASVDFIAKNLPSEFALESSPVWSALSAKRHPRPVKRFDEKSWIVDFDSFGLMGKDMRCMAAGEGKFIIQLTTGNLVQRVDAFIDLTTLNMGIAMCRHIILRSRGVYE
ncbi:hypothetical protein FVE85_9717 [Porphyridium purpureum]|uniref:Uncharacterized protein n=1 Tax=Porphyridium purpureum TaxID=35688 RepID=A0A5J4YLA2_PORPP|nr:hypothetical protein FVE85_9717 [Porphyridium purpureum]|eukprot:POR0402..scf246_12